MLNNEQYYRIHDAINFDKYDNKYYLIYDVNILGPNLTLDIYQEYLQNNNVRIVKCLYNDKEYYIYPHLHIAYGHFFNRFDDLLYKRLNAFNNFKTIDSYFKIAPYRNLFIVNDQLICNKDLKLFLHDYSLIFKNISKND